MMVIQDLIILAVMLEMRMPALFAHRVMMMLMVRKLCRSVGWASWQAQSSCVHQCVGNAVQLRSCGAQAQSVGVS